MITVAGIMSSPVFTLYKEDSLLDVRKLMEFAKIRHIPVVDEDETFLGLITHRDLLAYTISTFADINKDEQDSIDSDMSVAEIMQTDVHCITIDTSLKIAAKILVEHKYGCLPILRDNKLIGIITEADFLKFTIKLLEEIDT